MLTFKQFLIEAIQVSPLTKSTWPPVPAGGLDQARTMMFTALNDDDRGIKRLIAVEDGKTVGAASYYFDKAGNMQIDRVGSLKKGAGTQLMNVMIGIAKAKKAKKIDLVSSEMADTFYDRFGFVNTDEGDGHKVLVLTTS